MAIAELYVKCRWHNKDDGSHRTAKVQRKVQVFTTTTKKKEEAKKYYPQANSERHGNGGFTTIGMGYSFFLSNSTTEQEKKYTQWYHTIESDESEYHGIMQT